jgi:hypothetical protein
MVELLVAMTAGLLVALGAFALAKQGSRFFQQEARVANAQFNAALGFDRLRADIERAGFLTTANIQRDPFFCGDRATGPQGLTSLGALRLNQAGSVDAQVNGLTPDQIDMSGSYASPETFPVRTIIQNGANFEVYLQGNNGAVARSGGADGSLGQIFQAGRMMRILDSTGHYEFGQINNFAVQAGGELEVVLKGPPDIPLKSKAGNTCGVEGLAVGVQANVVNWIRYDIRKLSAAPPAGYQPLYGDAATAPGDENRFDLIRVELGADNAEIASTLEIVAEYAVDLKFGLTVVPTFVGGDGGGPTLDVFPIGDDRNYEYATLLVPAAPPTEKGPNRIRSVRARLVVRSREADRGFDIEAGGGNIFRYAMGDGGFARARTVTADISLPNLANLRW